MAYSPNASDATQPTTAQLAGNMAYELQAIKGRINSLVATGSNFSNIGTYRNRLKNGAFNVNQRGLSFTITSGTGAYTSDQWLVTATSGGNVGVSIVIPANTTQAVFVITPAAGNTLTKMEQRIESYECQDLGAGTQVTISGFFAASNTNSSIPTIQLTTPTTTIDNYSGAVSVIGAGQLMGVQQPQIAGTLQYFTNTFTLSASAVKGMQVLLTWTNQAGTTFNFTYVQLEKGSIATPFELRPVGVELALCQRYYYTGQIVAAGYGTIGIGASYTYPLPVMYRASPTIAFPVNSSANMNTLNATLVAGGNNVWFNAIVTATGAWSMNFSFTATCEL